jgi:hypothetical protein
VLALTAQELEGFREDLAAMLPDLADLERDASQAAPADPFGHPPAPSWVPHLALVPASYWQAGAGAGPDTVEVVGYAHRLAVPHGTDVRETDRVALVTDAAGVARTRRPMRVDAVIPRASHLELTLTELGG